ncbi:MAG: TniQ family protein [Thiobacillus sp.]
MMASCTPRLPVRPRPSQEESLSNYCLRVSESNGYYTPAMMLTMAGVSPRVHVGINEADKVATLVDVDPALLKSMAYVRQEDQKQGTWQRGGHQYRPCEITPRFTRICPACIQELGHARAVWDIRLVVACPKHQTLLLDSCPACGKTLTWMRRGLLTCSCGHHFSVDLCPPAPEWTSRVASLIERTVFKVANENLDLTWIPREVMQLPADDLLSFLTYWTTILSRQLEPSTDKILIHRTGFSVSELSEVLNMVGQAIAEWPLSHARTIARLFESHRHFGNHVKRTNFLSVVGASWIWAQSNYAPSILRDEVRTYLAERITYSANGKASYLHPRHIIPFVDPNNVRHGIGVLRAAELLGVGEELVKRLAKQGFIAKLEKIAPNSCAATFDLESVLSIKPYMLTTMDYREAAKDLCLSGEQFSSMVKHKILDVAVGKKNTANASRFRRVDISALTASFSELSKHRHELQALDFSHGIRVKSFWPNGRGIKHSRKFGLLMKAILTGKVIISPPPCGAVGIGEYLMDINSLAQLGFCVRPLWRRHNPGWGRYAVTGRFVAKDEISSVVTQVRPIV